MTASPTVERIAQVVADLRKSCRQPADPSVRGPVPLDQFFRSSNVMHVTLNGLSTQAVVDYLVSERFVAGPHVLADVPASPDRIDGFIFWAGIDGLAFINSDADSPLPRRRFTAAHELGHALLHRQRMGRFRIDVKVKEADDELDEMEHEANRFAVELLMPVEICRDREARMRRDHLCCPRGVLVYQLAAELLVSREAMRYRLSDLEVGDE
jgi:hypothetical protein